MCSVYASICFGVKVFELHRVGGAAIMLFRIFLVGLAANIVFRQLIDLYGEWSQKTSGEGGGAVSCFDFLSINVGNNSIVSFSYKLPNVCH